MRNPLKDPVVNTKQMLARKPQGKIMGFSKGGWESLVKKKKKRRREALCKQCLSTVQIRGHKGRDDIMI